jgi:hypothetical protein
MIRLNQLFRQTTEETINITGQKDIVNESTYVRNPTEVAKTTHRQTTEETKNIR